MIRYEHEFFLQLVTIISILIHGYYMGTEGICMEENIVCI